MARHIPPQGWQRLRGQVRRIFLGSPHSVVPSQVYLNAIDFISRTLNQDIMHRKVVTNESVEPLIGAIEVISHAWSFAERKAGNGAQRGKESLYDLRI